MAFLATFYILWDIIPISFSIKTHDIALKNNFLHLLIKHSLQHQMLCCVIIEDCKSALDSSKIWDYCYWTLVNHLIVFMNHSCVSSIIRFIVVVCWSVESKQICIHMIYQENLATSYFPLLRNRFQRVKISSVKNDLFSMMKRVLQDSVLKSTLFNIGRYDISSVLNYKVPTYNYADDETIGLSTMIYLY